MAGGDRGSGGTGNVRRLVIVESPTKARKIAGYLGSNYVVESSRGHIRDLPRNAADVPAKFKSEPWARLGVNVDQNFEPLYIVSPEKKSTVTELKGLLKDVDELYLATDGDREGEAIAWHLLETLKPRVPVKRMVFHEITEPAIRNAAENPRDLDIALVDAQETRRILDRLYGYEVSPVLWKKVAPKLSAGRVQSVATRIIVQRERERMAFHSASYWDVTAELDASVSDPSASPPKFTAKLNTVDGRRVATGRDFDSLGQLKRPDEVLVLDEASAGALASGLRGAQLAVTSVEQKPYTRRPYAPFMTSTLQQEAARKLRFSSERTMSIAQRLYENGYITYMRTDSTTLSESAINAARTQARQLYGEEYVHPSPRQYTRKVKNAQEAHEAIRPAGDVFQTPGQLHSALDTDEFRLYELIWQRTVASQMADARGTTLSLRIGGSASSGEQVVFNASGRTITFPGFLKAYVESIDELAGGESDDAESRLPNLTQGQRVDAADLSADGHQTSPPARYTEASLIKALEELGIGRPSTYSSIIKTIQDRGYVQKKGSALVPSWVAFAVVGLLEQHFGRLVDYDFTAAMEDELDEIANGQEQRTNWLNNFYFGGEHGVEGSIARAGGLKQLVGGNLEGIDAREVNSIKVFDDSEGRPVYVRVGRNGPYLERMVDDPDNPGEQKPQRANLKEDLTPDELTPELAEKLFATPQEGRSLGIDPETGHEIVAKDGRFGPYVTEVLPEPEDGGDDGTAGTPAKKGKKPTGPKPRTGSLFRSMDLETVTLEDALKLLSLPRVVGVDPTTNEEITAQNGRYGPYLKRGTDSRSLATEDQIFTITLDEALKIYAEPKRRGRQAASAPPLRELGNDPVSGKPMVIKDGRFGPYVTDGETNASLRKGDDVLTITDERASELLADRRARGPVKKKAPAKKAAKKAPAKKAAAKKA
ncbi:type I DNA topoisomerase [Mycolicibacterium smegmatis]|uniref:DNA topoisomerase 1 n=1 Tax=Mycolicibacterium smegmatis (strain ATCC 700084 / mc(2)155) TaxID=246196 RepID=TOP1_MYCS2|nr:type I DNA topoisomerase [Mycolicibacterium smegmatis]A0R5D9.1 RecName: Full=DNA topoisomerase 1; AltName: Full=DNA topoisomerase I [Mycolicibacterium smegmatis MC2 155]ABK69586.1 DNA topoisomerase I [Mycolicibacterium smegmatis MC2 155]AFP42431.1 DNA topoisomerase 1 [Mycolicibacterium smegmatis MC2 155]AIU11153.1 DNA topoisomerase I [Mycolicibacterium smegmatis MC2 155]AIU17777.1 DNA topoisomerase I [Mycolicibacterium smegmatis]AIU24401.1 DNA topoisomerase I [Mycolicibacterium smegmatis]